MRSKKQLDRDLEKQTLEQVNMDPVAAGERYLARLSMKLDEKVNAVIGAVGEESTNSALVAAFTDWRLYYGFAHALAEATGRRVYEVRWALHERMPNDFLRRRLQALKHGEWPRVELPSLAKEILEAIKATTKLPLKIFEGENEYQQHLQENGLVEIDTNDYVSRTGGHEGPSRE